MEELRRAARFNAGLKRGRPIHNTNASGTNLLIRSTLPNTLKVNQIHAQRLIARGDMTRTWSGLPFVICAAHKPGVVDADCARIHSFLSSLYLMPPFFVPPPLTVPGERLFISGAASQHACMR